MTFFQTLFVAFGLFVSFSTSWAVCPVLDINGNKFELYEDAASYADDLLELKNDLLTLGEDVEKELSTLPTNDDNLAFINSNCKDLSLFKKTIWFFNGDVRFIDFAKRLVKVEESKMNMLLNGGYIQKATNAADMAIEIQDLFEIKGSFAGLFFFLLVSFLVKKAQELAVYCILLGSLICLFSNEASATPRLSIWEGRVTKGKCLKEKKAVKKEINNGIENPSLEAGSTLVGRAVTAYSNCLKEEFRKGLKRKIKALKNKHLAIGDELNIKKQALLDEKFVNQLANTGYYLDNPKLQDVVVMAKVYFRKLNQEKEVNKIKDAKLLKD